MEQKAKVTDHEIPPEREFKCVRCGHKMDKEHLPPKTSHGHFSCPSCGTSYAECFQCKIIAEYMYIRNPLRASLRRNKRIAEAVCDKCRKEFVWKQCTHCGLYSQSNDLKTVLGLVGRICPDCMDKITVCHACRSLRSKDQMHPGSDFCEPCWRNQKTIGYTGYNSAMFRPIPVLFGKEGPFYGIELEVDQSQAVTRMLDEGHRPAQMFMSEDCIHALNVLVKKYKSFYMKSDGSLRHGFEIVSHPHNMDAWEEQTWLKEACAMVKEHHGTSYNAPTCGVHVHRSRDDLTDLHLSMLIVLFVRLQPFFERVAQRKENGYCHYAFFQDEQGKGNRALNGNVIYKAVKDKSGSVVNRYQALNLLPPATVECRIFRGTLCHDSLMAYIKFLHWLCEFVKQKDTALGKLLRLPVPELWNLLANFFAIDPFLTAYMQNKKIAIKGAEASERTVDPSIFQNS